jgi:hypothetical protein
MSSSHDHSILAVLRPRFYSSCIRAGCLGNYSIWALDKASHYIKLFIHNDAYIRTMSMLAQGGGSSQKLPLLIQLAMSSISGAACGTDKAGSNDCRSLLLSPVLQFVTNRSKLVNSANVSLTASSWKLQNLLSDPFAIGSSSVDSPPYKDDEIVSRMLPGALNRDSRFGVNVLGLVPMESNAGLARFSS